MPWKVEPVTEQRLALVHAVRTAGLSVAEAARRYGVERTRPAAAVPGIIKLPLGGPVRWALAFAGSVRMRVSRPAAR